MQLLNVSIGGVACDAREACGAMPLMNDRLLIAQEAARSAGALLRDKLGTNIGVRSKDVRRNLVTEVDTQSEALIRRIIGRRFARDAVLGEESGSKGNAAQGRWIVDPLDGTTNYAHGYRCFCVSIAYERAGAVQCGVVYDPMSDELFSAVRGKGAYCNGRSLHVSGALRLADALLVTGFPAHQVSRPLANVRPFIAFMRKAQAVRRDGSAALDLCYVADGRFDGFWEGGLHAWDIAAGKLLVEEAGGRVSGYRGAAAALDGAQIVASNGRVHAQMLAVLRKFA